MAFKSRAASVHNGSVRWKEADLVGSAEEQACLDQLRHHALSSKLAVTTNLTELWDALRRGDNPTSFLSTMQSHSLRARSLCQPLMHEDTPLRLADPVLRASHHVLIQDFSEVQLTVHQIKNWTPVEEKWSAVGGAIRLYEGEIRVLDVEKARWILTTVESSSELASSSLAAVKQFHVKEDGSVATHALDWLPQLAESNIEDQCMAICWLHGCW